MTRKTKYIRVRVDEELMQALHASAIRADRTPARHARYLLRLALGLAQVQDKDDDLMRQRLLHAVPHLPSASRQVSRPQAA